MLRYVKKFFIVLIVVLFFCVLFSRGHVYDKSELEYGITFSKKQADGLGLDWREMYLDLLDDLNIKKLRLPVYWNEIETSRDNYFWQDIDWQIGEAEKRKVEIILAVGGRLPRWPECHFPGWTENFSPAEREGRILKYIEQVIKRYRDRAQIVAWQIENEPFLSHFGDCPKLEKSFLDEEIALVRSLDSRPIIVTDSGELSIWVFAARRADIFGTTMYRDTYSQYLGRYIHYPITPAFFRFKKNITRLFAWPDKWIVAELQAEPWGPKSYQNLSQEERDRTMNLDKFREIIEFSRQTGFREFYLWGAEWWYWEKEVNGNNGLWREAKNLLNKKF